MDNTWVIKNTLVLEVSFTDYILALYVLCWLYALGSLFLTPIKGWTAEIKLSVLAETVQALFFQVCHFQVPERYLPHFPTQGSNPGLLITVRFLTS